MSGRPPPGPPGTPGRSLGVTACSPLAAALAATRLPTDAGTDTLVDSDTASYRATQQVREEFGEEPVVVLAEGDLQRLLLTSNLGRLLRLEGCLSGKVPKGAEPIPGPCAELARLDPVEFLAGPATFLNEAVIQIDSQLRRLAAHGAAGPAAANSLLEVAASYGITSAAEPRQPRIPRHGRLRPAAARAARRRPASPTSSPTRTRPRSSSACGRT